MLTISEIRYALTKRWYLLILLPVVFALISMILCWAVIGNSYTAACKITITQDKTASSQRLGSAPDDQDARISDMVTNLRSIISDRSVQRTVASWANRSDLSDFIIDFEAAGDNNAVTITMAVSGKDPQSTVAVANAVADYLTESSLTRLGASYAEVVQAASLVDQSHISVYLSRSLIAIVAGLLSAVLIIILLSTSTSRFMSPEDAEVEMGLPVIGRIPEIETTLGNTVSRDSDLVLLQSAKRLYSSILKTRSKEAIRSICITSSDTHEGTATTTVYLARAIADAGKRCVVVENDFMYGKTKDLLNVSPKYGIMSVLTKRHTLKEAMIRTQNHNVYFLDAEDTSDNPEDLLLSTRYRNMIDFLKEKFDYVIINAPSPKSTPAALRIAAMADGTLFVAQRNTTKRLLARKSIDSLFDENVRVIGLVMTQCRIPQRTDYDTEKDTLMPSQATEMNMKKNNSAKPSDFYHEDAGVKGKHMKKQSGGRHAKALSNAPGRLSR